MHAATHLLLGIACSSASLLFSQNPLVLNDVHSRLNATEVAEIIHPKSTADVVAAIHKAEGSGLQVSISGARHSMGGQQFAKGSLHLNMRSMNRVLSLDLNRRLVRAEAGITWTELLAELEKRQTGEPSLLTFHQKQTGADELTLGGAVSSNIHGRGLNWQPMVQDIESLTLVKAGGEVVKVSREINADLFKLVIGGYGLLGVITEVELRLLPRQRLERVVEISTIAGLPERIRQRRQDGYWLGDFQFCPDETSADFLREGVFACYKPLASDGPVHEPSVKLNPDAWRQLIIEAHTHKPGAWSKYKAHYLRTQGQQYWHDRAQFNHYDTDYEERIEAAVPGLQPGSLMISELYVVPEKLEDFMISAGSMIREEGANVIYGTIRFIKRDDVTFLPWARKDYACIVMNLRVTHTAEGKEKAAKVFRKLIDLALAREGSFFLTYHRWATPDQMLAAYPQFPEFLRLKKSNDPKELFQSEWYRHWRFLADTKSTSIR